MGAEQFHPNLRHAFNRAHEIRAGYLHDLLSRLLRPVRAWQRALVLTPPPPGQPITATPWSAASIAFARATASESRVARERFSATLAAIKPVDEMGATGMREPTAHQSSR
jgi:hypothetical protein